MKKNAIHHGIDLKKQVALVTGGGRGIGRAIALALAEAGASVAIIARNENELAKTQSMIEGLGVRAMRFPGDVTNWQHIQKLVLDVEEHLGPIDLLVNNAGLMGEIAPLWKTDPIEWWYNLNVNLRGTYLCCRATLPGMIARRKGKIINIASSVGVEIQPYHSAYSISKSGVIRLTEILHAETKDYGISNYALHPGFVRTAITETGAKSPQDKKYLGGKLSKAFTDGRDIPPERVARIVVYLSSGKGDILSGSYISTYDDVLNLVDEAEEIENNKL